jgi:hypothetical protein
MGQIRALTSEPMRIEQSTSNAPSPQKEHIYAQSAGHDKTEQGKMTSSSLAGMHIQFRTLTFHSRPKEQLHERLRLKKSTISLSAAIGAFCSPLGSHLESDIATDLYSSSTSIANIDESDHQTSFNSLKKSTTSLPAVIGALDSPLGPLLESDLPTDLYSVSTLIAIMDESDHRINFNFLNKFVISLSAVIEVSGSPL